MGPPRKRGTTRADGTTAIAEHPARTTRADGIPWMQLIPLRGIRVAASFPGRGGGCQGSNLFEPEGPRSALDTHHLG